MSLFQTVLKGCWTKSLSGIHRGPGRPIIPRPSRLPLDLVSLEVTSIDTTFHVGAFPFDLSCIAQPNLAFGPRFGQGLPSPSDSVSLVINDNHKAGRCWLNIYRACFAILDALARLVQHARQQAPGISTSTYCPTVALGRLPRSHNQTAWLHFQVPATNTPGCLPFLKIHDLLPVSRIKLR